MRDFFLCIMNLYSCWSWQNSGSSFNRSPGSQKQHSITLCYCFFYKLRCLGLKIMKQAGDTKGCLYPDPASCQPCRDLQIFIEKTVILQTGAVSPCPGNKHFYYHHSVPQLNKLFRGPNQKLIEPLASFFEDVDDYFNMTTVNFYSDYLYIKGTVQRDGSEKSFRPSSCESPLKIPRHLIQ